MSTPTDRLLFQKLVPHVLPDLPLYLFALCVAPVFAGLVVLQPYLLKLAIDDHVSTGDIAGVQRLAWIYLAVVVVKFALEAGHNLAISVAAIRTIARLRDAIFQHTLSLSPAFFDREPTGRLLTRATSDVDALGETMRAGAVAIVLDALQVIGVLGAMLWLDPWLTGVLFLIAPPLAVFVEILRRVLRRLFTEVRTNLARLNAYLSERLSGIQTVQLYSDEERTLQQFGERLDAYKSVAIRTNVFDALLYATVDGLSAVAMAMMLWYGSGGILDGVVTAGLLAAFIDYVGKLFRPIQEFSQKVATLQRASAALQKIFSLLDTDDHIISGEHQPKAPEGSVQVRDLSFAYGEGPRVIRTLDLDIEAGQVIAIVGRTGSGKSTIARLLTRRYDGYHGSITMDGVELTDWHTPTLRQTIGMVRQDVQLFPADVRFNLSLGAPISDQQLQQAIIAAQADQVVQRLGGLDGVIQHGASNVSAGEAQLLSFARTMAHDPPLVILDEATASVDSLTEARLQAATESLLERKTVLVIAHRLSTIQHADVILVMDAGEVVERGSHTELLAADGRYAELFRQQFTEQAL